MKRIDHRLIIRLFSLMSVFLTINRSTLAQSINENWVPVAHSGKLIYIDISDIKSFKGDDIYVWTMENHDEPINIEEIDKDIFKTKVYYLINKEIKKYSILEVIYFDKNNNVIKNYSYQVNTEIEDYKYNFPILVGSQLDNILQRCLREIEGDNE